MKIEKFIKKGEFKRLKKKIDLYDLLASFFSSKQAENYYFNDSMFNEFMIDYISEVFPKYGQVFTFRILPDDGGNKLFQNILLKYDQLEYCEQINQTSGRMQLSLELNISKAKDLLYHWIDDQDIECSEILFIGVSEVFDD